MVVIVGIDFELTSRSDVFLGSSWLDNANFFLSERGKTGVSNDI